MISLNPSRVLPLLRSKFAAAAISAGLACALSLSAHAQVGRSGMGALFVPDFLPRDLPVFVDSLGLEEWQRPILEALLEDYGTNFATAADGVRSRMSQFKDSAASSNPEKIVEMISAPLIDWGDEKKKLRDDFLESVRSQLSDVQSEAWSRFERAMRREKSLPNGVLSGESLNLILITRELEIPPLAAEDARAAMEEYEVRLDEALATRDREEENSIGTRLKSLNDSSKFIASEERLMALRVAVRSVQDHGVTTIRDALGSDFGAKFEQRALRRAFPLVYGPDPISPLIEGAQALSDLTEVQRGELSELQTRFGIEHGALQIRFADSIRLSEPKEPRRRAEALALKAAGGTPKFSEVPEIEAIKLERQELYSRFRAAIAVILSDAQRELIPGFGKPGADLPAGQRYGDATHLGKSGTKSGGATLGAEEVIEPAGKPKGTGKETLGTTGPGGAPSQGAPKKAE